MTEHTADLRREEIARIAETLRRARLVMFRVGTGYLNDPEEGAHALHDAGLRSQDTATARIAAPDVERLRSALEAIRDKAMVAPFHRRLGRAIGEIHAITVDALGGAPVRYREPARAVLSGETRTDGETVE